jgi:hypothetical protein
MRNSEAAWVLAGALAGLGCTNVGRSPTPAPTCDTECQDGVALRSLRDAMKLIYNLALQGKDVGAQDAMSRCPQGGSARVYGTATSNELQGATEVELTYSFMSCRYLQVDNTPEENYQVTVSGSIAQSGTLAVQPSSTTALLFSSDEVSLEGTVYAPPLDYQIEACQLAVAQSGNNLSGTLCGRAIGVEL